MSWKTLWDEDVNAPWTENKLLSRKWWAFITTIWAAIILDILGRELGPNTTRIIEIGLPAFLGIQGFVDMLRYRVERKRQDQRSGGDP